MAPFSGTLVEFATQGPLGGVPVEYFAFELADPSPVALHQFVGRGEGPPVPYFEQNKIVLKGSERTSLTLLVNGSYGGAATFDLQFSYLVGEERRTKIFDNDGVHFAVSDYNCVGEDRAHYQSSWAFRPDGSGYGPDPSPPNSDTCSPLR
jgi:hypothetical protein